MVGPTEAIWEELGERCRDAPGRILRGAVSALAMYADRTTRRALVVHIGMDPTQPWLNAPPPVPTGPGLAANAGPRYAPSSPVGGPPAHRGERPPPRRRRQAATWQPSPSCARSVRPSTAIWASSSASSAPAPRQPPPPFGWRVPSVRAATGHHLADVPGLWLAGAVPDPGQGRKRGVAHVRGVLERTRPSVSVSCAASCIPMDLANSPTSPAGTPGTGRARDGRHLGDPGAHRARTPDRRGSHPGRLSDGDAERCPQGRRGPRPRPPATARGGQDRRTALFERPVPRFRGFHLGAAARGARVAIRKEFAGMVKRVWTRGYLRPERRD